MSPSLPGLSQIRSKRHAAKRRFKNSHPDPPIHLTGRNGEKFPPETLTSWWCEADSGSSKNELLGGSALHPNLFQNYGFAICIQYNCILDQFCMIGKELLKNQAFFFQIPPIFNSQYIWGQDQLKDFVFNWSLSWLLRNLRETKCFTFSEGPLFHITNCLIKSHITSQYCWTVEILLP